MSQRLARCFSLRKPYALLPLLLAACSDRAHITSIEGLNPGVQPPSETGEPPAGDDPPQSVEPLEPAPPGALISVTSSSQVGVLLDEIPSSIRERVASTLLAEDEAFWVARARRQLALASYRLNFRGAFYPDEGRQQLPLPPEEVRTITVTGPARRAEVEGHDYVLVDYALSTVIVTDVDSPATSEPELAEVGGVWSEPFTFPLDPELLFQRTGYACMDEAQFPPNSVDSENVEFYFDEYCEIESELSPNGCHYTELPLESCLDALSLYVGRVETSLDFERIAYDEAIAAANRVGSVTNPSAADLAVVTEELAVNTLVYRYIDESSCAVAEGCVTGTGWRRLLKFNASEKNTGAEPVHIGDVDYFVEDPNNPTPNASHNIYEYSECHGHYHFSHYATFTYGADPDLGSKRAFCLQSVARYGNHESSPTWSPYGGCDYQGITQGWGDQYNAGIECQWLDVTTIDTSGGPVTQALGYQSNPDGFLCEGDPALDASGLPLWEPTEFVTAEGEPVDRPLCSFSSEWDANNYGEQSVTLPVPGEGLITTECSRGQVGRLRNCGFTPLPELGSCSAGTFELSCSVPEGSAPQSIRVCEASQVLGAGVACDSRSALALADVESAGPITLTVPCPEPRGAAEPGGLYAIYTAPTFGEDAAAPVSCSVVLTGATSIE